MRANSVKRSLQSGGTAFGTMVFEFNTPGIARIAAGAGAEFVLYDMEHTGWSIETIRWLLASGGNADTVPLVRVPATEYHLLSRPLDMGALGLMVPMVESAAQAREIVSYAKYAPLGNRGAAFGIAHDDYSGGEPAAKMSSANDEGLILAQIETRAGVDAADEIAAVDGIDLLWVGQFDLTTSLGIPAQFDHPDYFNALDRVIAACNANGKTAGMMVTSQEEGKAMLAKGFRCLAYWGDLWIYGAALGAGLAALRAEDGAS